MIVLYLLIILAAIGLWFLLTFLYKPIGKFLYRIWKDAIDEMKEEDKDE